MTPADRLRAILPARTGSWPMPVDRPVRLLVEQLDKLDKIEAASTRSEMAYFAWCLLRDAAESPLHVAFVIALHEALTAVTAGAARPASLRRIWSTAVEGFTAGSAYPSLEEATKALPGSKLLQALPLAKTRGQFLRLRDWRNIAFAHGVVGVGRHLADLDLERPRKRPRKGEPPPTEDLVAVLEAWSEWLAQAAAWGREYGWPHDADARTDDPPVDAPKPVAVTGSGGALWLLDKVAPPGNQGARNEPSRLRMRDVVRNKTQWFPWPEVPIHLLELLGSRRLGADLLDLTSAAERDVDHARTKRIADRNFKNGLLDDRLDRLVEESPVLWVTGAAGTGKSVLLHNLVKRLAGKEVVVLSWRGVPGAPGADPLRRAIVAGLEKADVRYPVLRGQPVVDPPADARQAGEWWESLAKRNSSLSFRVVLDALEEITEAGDGMKLLSSIPPEARKRIHIVASFRDEKKLAYDVKRWVGELSAGWSRTLPLDEFYAGDDGRSVLVRYIERRHPKAETQAAGIVDRAKRRFLAVFHYARAIERGVFDPATTWPEPDQLYGRLAAWLEASVGQHPRYVDCLRRILLTYARIGMPINDRTLWWLLQAGPAAGDTGEAATAEWQEWLVPVLHDVDDLLERWRATPEDGNAYEAVAPDAARQDDDGVNRSGDGFLRYLAHDEIVQWLNGPLPTEWEDVRRDVDDALNDRVGDAFAWWEQAPGAADAPLRVMQQRWAWLAPTEERIAKAHALLPLVDLARAPHPAHWLLASVGVALAARKAGLPWAVATAHSTGGIVMALLGRTKAAVRLHIPAVQPWRELTGLRPGARAVTRARAARDHPEAVKGLADALGDLGWSLGLDERSADAVAAYRERVELCRALAGVAAGTDGSAPDEAIRDRPDEVLELAEALGKLGHSLLSSDRPTRAEVACREEVDLRRALARLPPGAGADARARAGREREEYVAALAESLRGLADAIAIADPSEAQLVRQESVALQRLLAGVPAGADAATRYTAAKDREEFVSALAMGLHALGDALPEVGAHEEAVELQRLVASVPAAADKAAHAQAVHDRHGAVAKLANGLLSLGRSRADAKRPREAITTAYVEGVLLKRACADHNPGTTLTRLGLANALFEASSAGFGDDGRLPEARAYLEEAIAIFRDLGALPVGADAERAAAAAERRQLVGKLACALQELASLLCDLEHPDDALPALEELVACRRALARLSSRARAATRAAAVRERPEAVHALADALHLRGAALAAAGRSGEALAAHHEAGCLLRVLAGVPPGARAATQSRAARRDPAAVRTLAEGLVGLGEVLRAEGRVREAVRALQEAAALLHLLARSRGGHDRAGWVRVARARPEDVSTLVEAHEELALTLASAGQSDEAHLALVVELRRLLVGIPRGADPSTRASAATAHPDDVRRLAAALREHGLALLEHACAREAVASHEEGAQLWRLLAHLPAGATPPPLHGVGLQRLDDARDLAITLSNLGVARFHAGRPRAANGAHRESLSLFRSLAGLPADADQTTRAAVARERPSAVQDLAEVCRLLAALTPASQEALLAESEALFALLSPEAAVPPSS